MNNLKIKQNFDNKEALFTAGLHSLKRAGVAANKETHGNVSIVLSGKYNDIDNGNNIIYTGPGGREKGSVVHTKDQEYKNGNVWLHNSYTNIKPILVFRKASLKNNHSPKKGIAYGGKFYIDSIWNELENGFLVYKYKLVEYKPTVKTTAGNRKKGNKKIVKRTIDECVRLQEVVENVKNWNNNMCQVCGVRIPVKTEREYYSEGAHIKGFQSDDGPDIEANMLCLCPNHHKMMDYYGLTLSDDLKIISIDKEIHGKKLRMVQEHKISTEFVKFNRKKYEEKH